MIEYYCKQVVKEGNFFCFYIDNEGMLQQFEKLIDENVGKLDYATNVKGRMTSWHFFKKNILFKQLMNHIVPFYDKIKITEWVKFKPTVAVQDAWRTIMQKDEFVEEHTHMGSAFSSVLYFDNYADLQTEAGPFKTQRGKIITLPGWCCHWVNPIKEDVKRYTLVWNWNPTNDDIINRDEKDAHSV